MKTRWERGLAVSALFPVMLAACALASPTPDSGVRPAADGVVATYTLPPQTLQSVQNSVLPGSISNDRGILLGGTGSDLWRGKEDPPGEFWMVTDRGPNGQVKVGQETRRTFPVPEFTPLILRVGARDGRIEVREIIPIRGQSGRPVTGLSNIETYDESPHDFSGRNRLPFNPSGLDTEGLVRTPQGEFWLADEYSPSLVHVDRTGRVVKRYIPQGVKLIGADYPVAAILPPIYGKRKGNRGFEGLGISPDGETLYVALQSPLQNPNRTVGDASRNTRILAFHIPSERVTAEYVYRFDRIQEFDPQPGLKPSEMKVSGVAAVSATTLLLLERTDWVAKIYAVDLPQATNILGSPWDDPATTPSLEALAEPAAHGITVLPKRQAVDLSKIPGVPEKIEGIAVVDRHTLVVANDNDFDVGDFPEGRNVGKAAKSELLLITVRTPLY